MNLHLVRHGVTAWNAGARYQGWSDVELLAEGVAQARQTAAFFATQAVQPGTRFQAIYCSPLRRAAHTAAIIGDWLGLTPIAVPDLREMHGGMVEGLTEPEWQVRYPSYVVGWRDAQNMDFGWPGGETRRGFQARCLRAIAAVVARHLPADAVIIVAHGGVIKNYLMGVGYAHPVGPHSYEVANCSVTRVQLAPQTTGPAAPGRAPVCVPLFNSVHHLRVPVFVGGPADPHVQGSPGVTPKVAAST